MLQYPTGGGFLSQHDDVDPKYPEKIVNAILTITSRRKNKKNTKLNSYERGGLYFIKNKKKMTFGLNQGAQKCLHTAALP